MHPLDFVTKYIDQFREAIAPLREAFGDETFSYFAVKVGEDAFVVRGTLYLNVQQSTIPFTDFNSPSVRAGHFKLQDVGLKFESFIEQLLEGQIPTPHGLLKFPPGANGGGYGVHFVPFHEGGEKAQRRLAVLTIFGSENRELVRQPDLDWELRASCTPYESLNELLIELQPGQLTAVNSVDIAAFNVVAIDGTSAVNGNVATIGVRKAPGAINEKISVGYRILDKGKIVKRGASPGNALTWVVDEAGDIGRTFLDVPRSAIVQAFASYNGVGQHHFYFGDPNCFQNPRRAVYEVFDPHFGLMNDTLAKSRGARAPSRDFEAVMSWLFWMLGFGSAYIGGVYSEAPDIILATPNGHVAVIECTTNFLDENKLRKLFARSQSVRTALDASNSQHIRVLPIIISALTLDEIRAGVKQAEDLDFFVLTREGIDRLISRTLLLPNADQLLEEAESTVSDAREQRDQMSAALNGNTEI